MSTLLTRLFARPRVCTRCQVGQGRMCQCEGVARVDCGRPLPARKVGFRWPRVSDTTIVLALVVYDILAWVGAWHLATWAWRAWA